MRAVSAYKFWCQVKVKRHVTFVRQLVVGILFNLFDLFMKLDRQELPIKDIIAIKISCRYFKRFFNNVPLSVTDTKQVTNHIKYIKFWLR